MEQISCARSDVKSGKREGFADNEQRYSECSTVSEVCLSSKWWLQENPSCSPLPFASSQPCPHSRRGTRPTGLAHSLPCAHKDGHGNTLGMRGLNHCTLFIFQACTHSIVILHWRCMRVSVRITDVNSLWRVLVPSLPCSYCSPVVRVGENVGSVFLRLGKEHVKLLHKVLLWLKQTDEAWDIMWHKPPPLGSIA